MTTPTPVEQCTNCLKPVTNHRPWCADVRTAPPPQEGDIVENPLLGRVPLLSVYSRQQAIEDGTLVDCTQDMFDRLNREAGLKRFERRFANCLLISAGREMVNSRRFPRKWTWTPALAVCK